MGSVNNVNNSSGTMKFIVVLITVASIALAVFHGIEGDMTFALNDKYVFYAIAGLTIVLGIAILADTIRSKSYIAMLILILQLVGLIVFDFLIGISITCVGTIIIDWLGIIVVLLTGLMGGIIGLKKRSDIGLILSLLAIDGMALSDNLLWIYFFWLLMIFATVRFLRNEGKRAEEYASEILKVNIYGGVCFVVGITVSGVVFEAIDITTLNLMETVYSELVAIPVLFIVLASFARTMQVPFQRWYRSDYKVSADTSALIQSVTLVSSGAVLIIKMASDMGVSNFAGLMTIIVGGVTFFISSLSAITETNTRRVMTDSTGSVMGLIVICAGIGTSESIWAAIMLLIYNTVAKPLILTGAESLRLRTDFVMAAMVMMMAPFGIVLMQKNAMSSIGDTGNILLVLIVCFTGAISIFYWTRILGNMISEALDEGIEPIKLKEMNPGKFNAWLLIIMLVGMPFISRYMVIPYLEHLLGGMSTAANFTDEILGAFVMLLAVVLAALPISKGIKSRTNKPVKNVKATEQEETHEILRRSPITVKVQLICNIVTMGVIVLCLCFVILNLVGLIGGVM